MNISNKLIAKDVIRQINDFDYFEWTTEQCQERIQVMQKALNIINIVLEDISPMDLAARLHFSAEKRQVEHYLKICMDSLPLETTEDNFSPYVIDSNPTHLGLSVPKPRYSIWLGILGLAMIMATVFLLFFVL